MSEDDFINPRKEAIAKALKRLNAVNPMLKVIIIGHLMIEKEINELIKTLARFPDEADRLKNLRFPERVSLIRAFMPVDLRSEFWTLLLSFNQFRNDFAHNHDDEIKAKHLNEIRDNMGRLSQKSRGLSDDVALVRQSCAVSVGVLTQLRADLETDKDHWEAQR